MLVEPSLSATALHGKAVSRFLVGSPELVTAFMGEDPLLDDGRNLAEQARIEDEKSRIGSPIVVELTIQDRGTLPTRHPVAVERQISRLNHLGTTTDP
jgi:hypothetical protein